MATGHGGGGLFQWASNTPALTSASCTSAFLGRSKWSNPFSPLRSEQGGDQEGVFFPTPCRRRRGVPLRNGDKFRICIALVYTSASPPYPRGAIAGRL